MTRQRTFRLTTPHMEGADVRVWQLALNAQMARWGVKPALKVDGDYGAATRALTATVLYGLGITQAHMSHGVTPSLRTKVRGRHLTVAERARWTRRAPWRAKLKRKFSPVAPPLAKVIADSWGWHPGVHDGMDLICPPAAAIHSMCDGVVVRADTGGWWGKAPSGDVAKGDGIIIVRCEVDAGPFRKGMNICYGHAEHPRVNVGQKVKAGEHIATAGLAVAWHIHLMVNDDKPGPDGRVRGVGDRDPRPFYDYARKHG